MTPPYCLETDVEPIVFRSVDELDSTLERLQREYTTKGPTSVVISEAGKKFGTGDEIGLGLGLDPTFVLIQIAPCDGEYYFSVGDDAAAGSVEFFGAREIIVVDRLHFVPWQMVRVAIREFLEYGRRTKLLRWQDSFGQPAD